MFFNFSLTKKLSEEALRKKILTYCEDRTQEKFREEICGHFSGLIHQITGRFSHRGEPPEDIRQVAWIGFCKALERFDPTSGDPFQHFAVVTMVGEIKKHFRDHAWMVKVPRPAQELSNEIRKVADRLREELDRSPTVAEIAQSMNIPEETILEGMDVTNAYFPRSMDEPMNQDDSSSTTLGESIGTLDEKLQNLLLKTDVDLALAALCPRERVIIRLRFYWELPQRKVAERLGTSQMHVSRLERQALSKLKHLLSEKAA